MKRRLFVTTASTLISMAAVVLLLFILKTTGRGVFHPALAAPQSPVVTSVNPTDAPNDIDTPILITGTGFTAVPTVTLGSMLLEDISWVSAEQLTATIPWGMVPGVYALTVENPGGELGSLADAFTVTQGIGMWTTGGPYGGDIVDLVMNPVTSTTLYAVAHNAGVFASYDGADNWQPILLDATPIRLVFDADNPEVMYFGSDCCIKRTEDGGSNWELVTPPGGYRFLYPAAHPITSGVVYASSTTPPSLFRSDDYGDTWVTRTNGLTDTNVLAIAFHPEDANKMLAGTESGNLFLSVDGGENWDWKAEVSNNIGRLYFNPFGSHEAWATSEYRYNPPHYLYKSEDPGLGVWTPVDVAGGNAVRSLTFLSDTIWAAASEGFTSTNGGASWSMVNRAGLESGWRENTMAFAIDPGDQDIVYAGSKGQGTFKSSDGGATWSRKNKGLAAVVPRGLAVTPTDPDTLYAETYALGILKSSNGGQTWRSLGIGKGGFKKPLAVDPHTPDRIYMGDQGSGEMRFQISEDGGDNWHEVTTTLPVAWSGWKTDILQIAPHPKISGTILAGARFLLSFAQQGEGTERGAVYISDDYGEHWEFAGPTQPISVVVELAYDAADPNLIYAATSGTNLWKTIDGGASWGEVTSFPGSSLITSVAAHPDVPSTVFARCDDSMHHRMCPVYFSRDAGETWEELQPCENCDRLLFAPQERGKPSYTLYTTAWPRTQYASTEWSGGLYQSMDGGYNWERVEGVPATDFYSLAAGSDDERVLVYVGISGGVVTPPSRAAAASAVIHDQSVIVPGGVYRWGNWLNPPLYFPLMLNSRVQ